MGAAATWTSVLAVGWQPEIRGWVVFFLSVIIFVGTVYLIAGTNLGARLGFLVVLAGLFGWMATMGAIWWTYGIGLKGREPTWLPAEPAAIIRDGALLPEAEVVERSVTTTGDTVADAAAVADALESEGWILLAESDPRRGQAVASSDAILQNEAEEFAAGDYVSVAVYDRGGDRFPKINESLDFVAFFHTPHHALVEVAPVVPQRVEPGRAPARPKIDESQPRRYVYMLRDMGNKRQPAMLITLGSTVIFLALCWVLHRRDLTLRAHLGERIPAKV
ncbi:MAG: hypothetical protein ACO26C_07240 [Ilumatobacteraceae bacterium]